MPRSTQPKWGTSALRRNDITREIRLSVAEMDMDLQVVKDMGDFVALCWDAAYLAGIATRQSGRPERRRVRQALKMLAGCLNDVSSALDELNPEHEVMMRKLTSARLPLQMITNAADVLYGYSIDCIWLAEQIAWAPGFNDAPELTKALSELTALTQRLDDYSQDELFDRLSMQQMPSDRHFLDRLQSTITMIADAATDAGAGLAKSGREPNELAHTGVARLAERFESITGKPATYNLDDDDKLNSRGGTFIIRMFKVAGIHLPLSTLANALKGYRSHKNKKDSQRNIS